jgi:hypothetical protein
MSIIVETGLNVAGANSYISLIEANTYHTAYGNTAWDTSGGTDYTTALIVATQALDAYYGAKYESAIPVGSTQPLLWPRLIFWDKYGRIRQSATIPQEIKNAQAEFALLYSQGTDLFPQLNVESNLVDKIEKVGDVMIRSFYNKTTPVSNFRKVDLLLYAVLKGTATGNRQR